MENEEIVLNLLKYSLFGIKDTLPDKFDWDAIYKELRVQTVQNLICPISSELPNLDEEAKLQLLADAGNSVPNYFKILKLQQEIFDLLSSQGIACVVLKGTAAAMYYHFPEYRSMGDIDLLIEEGRAKEAADFLIEQGYEILISLELSTRHYNLRKNGIEIEVHKHFSSFEDKELSAYLDKILFSAMGRIETAKSYGYRFPVLPKLENGLVLLCHINQHLLGGLGLRQICDWLMYAKNYLNDDYWNSSFKIHAQKLGLEKMAVCFTHIAQMYLGFPTENYSWCLDADEELCDEMLNYIFRSGNFGRKKGTLHHVDNTIILMKEGSIFKVLQNRGERNFASTIKKHPWIKPFICIPQAFRTIRRGFNVINNKDDLINSYKDSDSCLKLMEKIGRQE